MGAVKEARVIRNQGERPHAVHMRSRKVKSDMELAPKCLFVGPSNGVARRRGQAPIAGPAKPEARRKRFVNRLTSSAERVPVVGSLAMKVTLTSGTSI